MPAVAEGAGGAEDSESEDTRRAALERISAPSASEVTRTGSFHGADSVIRTDSAGGRNGSRSTDHGCTRIRAAPPERTGRTSLARSRAQLRR